MKNCKKGISFIELMIVAAIMFVAIAALVIVFMGSISLTTQAKEMTYVADDAQDVFEKLHSISVPQMVALFPHNTNVDLNLIGGGQLRNENITVSYPSGTADEEVDVLINVTWTDKRGYPRYKHFRSMRIKGVN